MIFTKISRLARINTIILKNNYDFIIFDILITRNSYFLVVMYAGNI